MDIKLRTKIYSSEHTLKSFISINTHRGEVEITCSLTPDDLKKLKKGHQVEIE